MNKRENLLSALRREKPEYVPFEFELCPSHIEEFRKRTGENDYMEYYDFPYRYVKLNNTNKQVDYSAYYKDIDSPMEPLSWNPEWGVMGKTGSIAHFQEMLHPMKNFEEIDEIDAYPFPDFIEDYRWEGVKEKNNFLINKGYATIARMQMTIFEISWYLRGMDNFMMDMILNPEFNNALLDKITNIRVEMAKRYAEADTDILMLGDDVSTQEDMMLSPDLWREKIKPRLSQVIKAAKDIKKDILIFYHGDGNLKKIIPDLIEIGVDVLNPVQPECVDPFEIKDKYGDKLSFWGCLGTQTTMPFGTKEDVENTCIKLINEVGKDGGLVLAPTHMIEPDVPYDNLETFINTVRKYGVY